MAKRIQKNNFERPSLRGALFIKIHYAIITLMDSILYIIFLAVIIFSAVLTGYSALIGAPFLPTPARLIKMVFEEAGLKKGNKIYDLGSGTGKTLIIAEKYFGATAVGFELSPVLYVISKINIFLRGDKNSKVILGNFYNQNISDADMIFIFLMPRSIERLKSKFEKELRKGTKVISYAFEMKGWNPKKTIREEKSQAVFVYEIQ